MTLCMYGLYWRTNDDDDDKEEEEERERKKERKGKGKVAEPPQYITSLKKSSICPESYYISVCDAFDWSELFDGQLIQSGKCVW